MSDMNKQARQVPCALHFAGPEAEAKFDLLLDRALDEDSIGGAYGYKWIVTTRLPIEHVPTLVRIDNPSELKLEDFQMVILDGGNLDGDSWKYIYHPAAKSGTFIQEA